MATSSSEIATRKRAAETPLVVAESSGTGFVRPVSMALWQGALKQPSSWAEEVETAAKSAKSKGAELLMFPELFLPGYHLWCDMEEDFDCGAAEIELTRIARDVDLALCIGFPEPIRSPASMADKGLYWNSNILIDQRGEVKLRYRKHHTWGNEANLGLRASDDPLEVTEVVFKKEGAADCKEQ